MQRIRWVIRLQCCRDGKSNVKGDVSGGDCEEHCEDVKGLKTRLLARAKGYYGIKTDNQRGWCAILNDLSCHESVSQERPEKSGNSTCMNGCKDDKRSCSLFEKGTRGDKLEGESKKVDDEKCTKLDTTWGVGSEDRKGWKAARHANGSLSAVTTYDEPDENQNTERASEDIGDVADRTFKANAWDTTLWIDSYRGG